MTAKKQLHKNSPKQKAEPVVDAVVPDMLGEMVDLLYTMRTKRLEIQAQADEIKTREGALRGRIMARLAEHKIEGAKGTLASCGLTKRTVAAVKDWDKLYAYIAKEKAWDMLQKRINDAAYRARLEEGVKVPGTEPFELEELSLTKVK